MPASFARDLCGYRANGDPNTSDTTKADSKMLGRELFRALRVPDGQPDPGDVGASLERRVQADLADRRPDLLINRSTPLSMFDQYRHLAVLPAFKATRRDSEAAISKLRATIERLHAGPDRERLRQDIAESAEQLRIEDQLVRELLVAMPEESLLAVDISIGQQEARPMLPTAHIALSAKWSLRTDRAQDCISQGAKMVAQRRGRMPHFAVITMEPRPYYLKILADGSGAIDCVYHLALDALEEAIKNTARQQRKPETWAAALTFERLMMQGRLRDYDDLVREVDRVPRA
jgi:hypothetical protein